MPLGLRATTNSLTSALQKGMFEEEANRNLDAAVSNYQSLAAQFDQDRQIAATAMFRLGECYRKLGRTNDAVVQYQRIVREFSDQADARHPEPAKPDRIGGRIPTPLSATAAGHPYKESAGGSCFKHC